MNLVPVGDKVVVQRVEAEERTRGGVVLPDAARERPAESRVLSVGDGVSPRSGRRAPFQVSEGGRVLFSRYAGTEVKADGTEVKADGTEVLLMPESEIPAILT